MLAAIWASLDPSKRSIKQAPPPPSVRHFESPWLSRSQESFNGLIPGLYHGSVAIGFRGRATAWDLGVILIMASLSRSLAIKVGEVWGGQGWSACVCGGGWVWGWLLLVVCVCVRVRVRVRVCVFADVLRCHSLQAARDASGGPGGPREATACRHQLVGRSRAPRRVLEGGWRRTRD